MAIVTLNGVRLNAADANAGWGNFNVSGQSPAAEPQLKYQGSNAVNKKVTSTTSRGGVAYTHGSGTDMTGSAFPLWVCKMKVGDAGDLNAVYGCEATIGSGSGARHSYNISGSGANNDQFTDGYNSQGGLAEGYIIAAINPNIAQWRDATTGNPSLSATDYFAIGAQFVSGGAKSENVACDAIDLGAGLDYNGTGFSFGDGADTDQGVENNRWGFACRNGSIISLRGLHRIGTSATTSGTDTSTVIFVDGYHGSGDAGIEYDTTRASAVLNGSYTGLGRSYAVDDTRPDLTFVGDDTFTVSHAPTVNNFNRVTLRSSVTLDGANVECSTLTQAGGTMTSSTLRCDGATGVAMCSDPDFTRINNCDVIQTGSGYAFEIATPGTLTFTGLSFSGFGADEADNAAIYNNSGGLVTINVTGGSTPSVRNGAGASTVINNTVNVTLTGLFVGTRIKVYRVSDNVELGGVESASSSFSVGLDAGVDVTFRLISLARTPLEFDLTVPATDTTIPISQQLDRVYENS